MVVPTVTRQLDKLEEALLKREWSKLDRAEDHVRAPISAGTPVLLLEHLGVVGNEVTAGPLVRRRGTLTG